MTHSDPHPPEIDDDSRLARFLDTLTINHRAGRELDPDHVARDAPELASELRELWAAALMAEELARDDGEDPDLPGEPVERLDGEVVGDCLVLEELGRGGMGIVHRARQIGLGRVVALKRMRAGSSSTPQDVARFRVEAEAAARLDHPNVVAVYAVDSHAGEPYILMRYVEGTTLARRLADGPLPARDAARLLAPVCRAIQYAHDHGVVHRDLKPSNILIDHDDRPLVSDFGLAKRVDAVESLTQSGAVLGTPSYMAPEQAAAGRGPVGPLVDVYALGAILYQTITGRPPFLAASPFDTLLLVLEQEPVPPRLLNPRADADLEMIALKCLQKAPEFRYPNAGALADDLEAFLAGEPVSARSSSLRDLLSRLLRETHHAPVQENWGVLWMLHSGALIFFYGLTNWFVWRGVTDRWPYVMLFTAGLGGWCWIFWTLRRRGGPILFVERQLVHIWAAGIIALNMLFLAEWLLDLPVLTLAPLLAVTNGSYLLIKGGILSGSFYIQALVVLLTIFPMAWFPRFGPIIFGLVSASCFFITGLTAQRRKQRSERLVPAGHVR